MTSSAHSTIAAPAERLDCKWLYSACCLIEGPTFDLAYVGVDSLFVCDFSSWYHLASVRQLGLVGDPCFVFESILK